METNTRILKNIRRQQRLDRQRIFRVVEYLDYSAVFEKCPVEITDGYTISDVDNYDIFASFVFRNVSKKRIRALDIQLICHQKQNFSALKIPFTYSNEQYSFGTRRMNGVRIRDKKLLADPDISTGESFGETVYIPIPENFVLKFELEIVGVKYIDGTYEQLGLIAGKSITRFTTLGDEEKYLYNKMNIFTAAEELFPTTVLPQKGENAWLCCCGHKNINDNDKCERCLRERDWQFENIDEEKLEASVKEIAEAEKVLFRHDKTNYPQDKYLETEEEIRKKVKAYEIAMKNVAELERKKESMKKWIIPRIILCIAVIYLIYFVLAKILL